MRRSTDPRDVALGLAVVCGRAGVTAGKVALAPLRVAVRSPVVGSVLGRTGERLAGEGRAARAAGRDQLEATAGNVLASPEVERTVDQALAGPLPEAVARALVEQHVLQRVAEQVVASVESDGESAAQLVAPAPGAGLDRLVEGALDSRAASDIADRLIESAELQRLIEEIASSPAVRAALTRQTTTLAGELATGLRARMEGLDNTAGRTVRRSLRREPATRATAYGGLGARGIAFVLDMGITLLVFLVFSALGALLAALVGGFRPSWLAGVLAGVGWATVVGIYLVVFWTVTGQTPGMRVMRLRVVGSRGGPPGLGRSLLRLLGLVLATVPLCAGFLPVLVDKRRRALQDFLAGTVVRFEQADLTLQLGP